MPRILSTTVHDGGEVLKTLDYVAEQLRLQGRAAITADGTNVARAALRAFTEQSAAADLWLVTEPMRDAALDAAQDIPPSDLAPVMPSPSGLISYRGALPALSDGWSGEVVTWATAEHDVYLALWARATAGRGLEDPSGLAGDTWRLVLTVRLPKGVIVDVEAHHGQDAGRVVSLVLATWILALTPTVGQVSSSRQAGPKVGKGGRRGVPREVKVVELRQLAHRPNADDETDSSGRRYTHRWIVRGHWRQQACGPAQSLRRATWIPSYVKGPEDAPFLADRTVFVWRR